VLPATSPESLTANQLDSQKQADNSLFVRHPGNPILSRKDWPYPVNSVFNAGATLLPDGDTLLLCRVEDRRGLSHLCAARSANGVDGWRIDPQPTLAPSPRDYPEEIWGIEDPRITYVPELQQYAVAYTSFARGGPGVSLALTKDFRSFERYGVIMPPEDKDAALQHWGNHKVILQARRGGWWDANKIGLCSPPIETTKGWLVLYHGVRQTASGSIYRLGLALFDIDRPDICLQRGDSWMFGPEADYERTGDVRDVVFPCGQTIGPDGDTIHLYYGAADSCMAMATGSIRALLSWLDTHSSADAENGI